MIADPDSERWGTPLQPDARRLLLLGSGELGKEVVIEAMRLGLEVIAADSYADAPAMQVAHRARVLDMQDGERVRALVEEISPHLIVSEDTGFSGWSCSWPGRPSTSARSAPVPMTPAW